MRWLVGTGIAAFGLDQASKWFVMGPLDLGHFNRIDVLPPFLRLHLAQNRGVNFGLFAGYDMRWVLVAVALAISATVILWVLRENASLLAHVSAGLLAGGALGNVVDRVFYGWVLDFLNMSCCGFENPYAFNIADIAVFLGAIGLVLLSGSPEKSGRKKGP